MDDVLPPSKLELDDALADRIALLFQEADTDGNGTLSRKEFCEVILALPSISRGNVEMFVLLLSEHFTLHLFIYFASTTWSSSPSITAFETLSGSGLTLATGLLRISGGSRSLLSSILSYLPSNDLTPVLHQVFELIGSEIGLTSVDVLHIMAEADNNDDGVIEYREFIPVATEIIHVSSSMASKKRSTVIDNQAMHT